MSLTIQTKSGLVLALTDLLTIHVDTNSYMSNFAIATVTMLQNSSSRQALTITTK